MDVSLVMVRADGSSREFKLERDTTVIGRDEHARLRIPLPSVSRRHCELKHDGDEVTVTDLGSANGTFVNGQKAKTAELSPGDLLAVGPVVFVVRIDGFPCDIDAKDAYAAGLVAAASEDGRPGIPAAGRTSPPKPPAAAPPAPRKSLLDDDDDNDVNISQLLKDLDFDDDDDDEKPGPAKPPAPGPKKK
ncbi:MAG: FHA domain-containing protein [Phycisphaerales bacterium]|nr:FHA domain-containing protein [Phycisphaerales bacterium]